MLVDSEKLRETNFSVVMFSSSFVMLFQINVRNEKSENQQKKIEQIRVFQELSNYSIKPPQLVFFVLQFVRTIFLCSNNESLWQRALRQRHICIFEMHCFRSVYVWIQCNFPLATRSLEYEMQLEIFGEKATHNK